MSRKRNVKQVTRTTDGWENPITGVGGLADKAAGFVHHGGDELQWDNYRLSDLYETDDIAARIVDAVVDEALRVGYKVQFDDQEKPRSKSFFGPSLDTELDHSRYAEAITDWEDTHEVAEKVSQAEKWARLYGGAALFLGSDDGKQDQPLELGANLHFIAPYGKDELTPARHYRDPLRPNFGKVSHYRITPVQSASRSLPLVHESRLILFTGYKTTRRKEVQNLGWGSSVLVRCINSIKQFNGSYASALALLADANQNIYKIKDFQKILVSGNESRLKTRLDIIEKFRSVTKAMVMDADGEDFVRSSLAVQTGLSDLLQQFALRIAAAARMPATVLLSQSPAGMNATGESDRALWQAQAETERLKLEPKFTRLYRVAFHAKNGPTKGVEPASWKIYWPPLWVPTGKEAAEIEQLRAQTHDQYITSGVVTAKQVAKAEFGGPETQRLRLQDDDLDQLGAVPDQEPTNDEYSLEQPLDASLDAHADGGAAAVDAFAAQMTEHRVERCPHGSVNRCPRCGIERVRSVALDEQGNHIWPVAWRRIGAAAPEPEPAEA